mmetsp:Transcript_11801/g.32515  ORF Transcript_11801/g.32515 Transcript_11801/m.32515 type:complete len:107 (-) Transcript_11801:133-453(-)
MLQCCETSEEIAIRQAQASHQVKCGKYDASGGYGDGRLLNHITLNIIASHHIPLHSLETGILSLERDSMQGGKEYGAGSDIGSGIGRSPHLPFTAKQRHHDTATTH